MLFHATSPELNGQSFAGCSKIDYNTTRFASNSTLDTLNKLPKDDTCKTRDFGNDSPFEDPLSYKLNPNNCKCLCNYEWEDHIRKDYCACLWRYTEGKFMDTKYPKVHVIMLMVLMGFFILSTIEGLLEACQCVTNAPYKLLYKNRSDEWGNVQNFISK